MQPTNKYSIISGLIFSMLIASVIGCSSNAEEKEKTEKAEKAAAAPAATETFPLEKEDLSTAFHTPGELISFRNVDLYARETSFVKKIYADVGSEVKEGQLLVSMEAPELNSRLAGAESRVKAQEAAYIASKANYSRLVETSKTPGTISQNDLDQALARMDADYAQLQSAKASQKEIGASKNYLEIRAPFGGIITAKNVSPGAYVGPAGKGSEFPIFTLQEQRKMRLVVSIPEAYVGYVTNQTEISFSVKAYPNQKFKAKVKRLAGALDSRLRSERIEMDVFNDDKKLFPGMVAEVEIPLSSDVPSFVIPKTALVNSMERVFVVKVVDNKALWVDVKKGREMDSTIEIFSGDLKIKDQLVKKASEEVRNGSVLHTKLASL
ncbi:efflux RND transporter periplasmic adaptor subunit [Dyadobacter subterraneus]|uniref:Efflux RND transporter periplasmic adaptor subunit n=1 Tax=Dyadobacter subterraneus TaxID=2773304 RepID=A0ABR9W8K5_9BACT|nr:efflux RND transporter periplasmic adaptor subunit [Dyadobacter subterraneus]MBE9461812.1 efflux RND transporter periplasmic adaptor subunit [Dyadobacter subterraneus]